MRDARWGRDVWGLLRAIEVPMIASMHGNAVGFGFELALQCDYRVAADDCVVALPEARVGMIPAGGATQTLPRVVGSGAALHAVLTGERVPAGEALVRGFVDEVVAAGGPACPHRRPRRSRGGTTHGAGPRREAARVVGVGRADRRGPHPRTGIRGGAAASPSLELA